MVTRTTVLAGGYSFGRQWIRKVKAWESASRSVAGESFAKVGQQNACGSTKQD